MNEIMNLINNYLKLKDDYKKFNKENLSDVFFIFANEVYELYDVVSAMDYKIDSLIEEYDSPNKLTKHIVLDYEECLLNEIADVLLTTARIIKEFNLTEPLIEMIGYKYFRQCNREENNKNGR